MVWIPPGIFKQGAKASDKMAMNHERPEREVMVNGFFMDIIKVKSTDLQKLITETGYMTLAEKEIDWEEMKRQLPIGSPKPCESILQADSLTLKKSKSRLIHMIFPSVKIRLLG